MLSIDYFVLFASFFISHLHFLLAGELDGKQYCIFCFWVQDIVAIRHNVRNLSLVKTRLEPINVLK